MFAHEERNNMVFSFMNVHKSVRCWFRFFANDFKLMGDYDDYPTLRILDYHEPNFFRSKRNEWLIAMVRYENIRLHMKKINGAFCYWMCSFVIDKIYQYTEQNIRTGFVLKTICFLFECTGKVSSYLVLWMPYQISIERSSILALFYCQLFDFYLFVSSGALVYMCFWCWFGQFRLRRLGLCCANVNTRRVWKMNWNRMRWT